MEYEENGYINIVNAYENNLKNVSIKIPKNKITVFTGVSGSGKSSLCFDTIAAESRRELNATFPTFVQQYLPKYGRPKVELIEHLPVTIVIDQKKPVVNNRSTVGTYTDILPLIRLLFSRVGEPFVGYSESFSYNHPNGQCRRCQGLGEVSDLDIHKLVDFDKCLNDQGVINYPAFTTGAWRWKRYAYSGLFDLDKKIKDYSKSELELFLYSPQVKLKNPPDNWPKSAKFEGIYPRMYRSVIHTKEGKLREKLLEKMVVKGLCPVCCGTRLNEKIRSCKINNKNIAEVADMSITDAISFINSINNSIAEDLKREISKRLGALVEIGLSYLSLSRGTITLSGGEAQRIKIAKYINSALTDIVYVLDEPSVGLHPRDIQLLKDSVIRLRKHGNTVLIVEHHREIIKMADFVVDMGPGAGTNGGKIVFSGTYNELLKSNSVTGNSLKTNWNFKDNIRAPKAWVQLNNVNLHNLKNLYLKLPLGVLTVIAGVAGSGKSSLMDFFNKNYKNEIIMIEQKNIGINIKSTPATYLEIAEEIRNIFAKENKVSKSLFSFNSAGGCLACKGKGIIVSEMAFMDSIETLCELCNGRRYSDEVFKYIYRDKNISEVMDFTVNEAAEFFKDQKFLYKLQNLQRVGLGYIHLNQSMTTLSGGELQRVKLASEFNRKGTIFIIDEPTDGLHLQDTKRLMMLFNEMVDNGNTLFLVEHSVDVIKNADYLIELGPKGGDEGGELLYCGEPRYINSSKTSITKNYL